MYHFIELLLTEGYTTFILTVDANAVCIYLSNEGKFKIFDSHSRDKYGRSHPLGTCVLLEADTINNVIQYFKSLYIESSQFELKAVVIEELEKVSASDRVGVKVTDNVTEENVASTHLLGFSQTNKITNIETNMSNSICSCKQCSAISLYSLCFSTLKPCNYWDSKTVAAVVNFGTTLYNHIGVITSSNLPKEIKICGTDVHVNLQANYQGKLNAETGGQWNIESLIRHNDESTGFLIWLGGYSMSCIFQQTSKYKSYSILAYDDYNISSTAHFVKNIVDEQTLVDAILNLARTKIKEQIFVCYEIQYLSCSSRVTNNERRKTIRRHSDNYNKLKLESTKKRPHFKQVKYRITDEQKRKKTLHGKRAKYQALDETSKHELLKKNRNHYKRHREKILKNKRAKYQALDEISKQKLLNCYKTMEKDRKQKKLERQRKKYQAMDHLSKNKLVSTRSNAIVKKRMSLHKNEKTVLLNKEKEKRLKKKSQPRDIETCITVFKEKIKAGPFYICCVCNRTLYKKSVLLLHKQKYPRQDCFVIQPSFDCKEYICKTCHSKLKKGQQPSQAVINNLFVDETPVELAVLEKLEQILIAQRIVFEKIVIMPKGQQRKIKGAICNVPVECSQTCNVLPRPLDRSGIILLKLKRKLQFRGHVYFQAVRPRIVIEALNWLVANNPLYKNIQINFGNIRSDLTTLNCSAIDQEDESSQSQINAVKEVFEDDAEEQDDPLNEHRSAANETCLQPTLPNYPVSVENANSNNSTGKDVFNIAPGEGKHPVSMMSDKLFSTISQGTIWLYCRTRHTIISNKVFQCSTLALQWEICH